MKERSIWFISLPNAKSKHLGFNFEEIKQERYLALMISDVFAIPYVLSMF